MKSATKKPIRSLIVDDIQLNIEILVEILQKRHPEIEIVGIAMNGLTAVEKINSLHPDLIFLDIEMPDLSGFEVLKQVEEINFQTIFVTSYSEYAIQAIRFNALDYLLKPIDQSELATALNRYRLKNHDLINRNNVKHALENLSKEAIQDQRLNLPTHDGGIHITLGDIVSISGERNYSIIHLSNRKTKLSSKNLGYFEEVLEAKGFFRCHKSHLVNASFVLKFVNNSFALTNGEKIPIARRRLKIAREWLSKL